MCSRFLNTFLRARCLFIWISCGIWRRAGCPCPFQLRRAMARYSVCCAASRQRWGADWRALYRWRPPLIIALRPGGCSRACIWPGKHLPQPRRRIRAAWRGNARRPAGICHGDLFRDNVFFVTQQGDSAGHPCRLSGFFDFYFAGLDKWLFDIAVCINDWCVMPASGQYEEARVRAFLTAYQAVRAFTPLEAVYWPALLRAAALRFWLSRLHDFYVPRPAKILNVHDPAYFERILRTFIAKRL